MMVKEKLPVNEPFVVKKLNSVQNLKSGKCLIQFFFRLIVHVQNKRLQQEDQNQNQNYQKLGT
jgi:hypothetical protein